MNNKSKLLIPLIKRKILIKKKKSYYIKFDSFELFKISKISAYEKDGDLIVLLKTRRTTFEYWVKQNLIIPPWQTHWFQLKGTFILKLKGDILTNLLDRTIKKASNLNILCKTLGMSAPSFYNLKNGKISMASVKKLKRLLSYLEIPYPTLNNKVEFTKKGFKISIKNPKFPIDLKSKYGALLLGAIVSDGCIYFDKKAGGVLRTKYSTSEEESINSFMRATNKVYGEVHFQREYVRNCIILRIGSSIIGDTLAKVGAIIGHKAKLDKEVPWLIQKGPKELKRHYLKAVFSDEASIYLGKKYYDSYIILSRYKHLNKLTKEQQKKLLEIEKHMSERTFPIGHINKNIPTKRLLKLVGDSQGFASLLKSPPNLLKGESEMLNKSGIKNRLWSRSLNKTHLGNYSICYDLFISRNEALLKFYREIGFSLSTKQEKLIKLIKNINIKNGIKTV